MSDKTAKMKRDFIEDFGSAYKAFGLSRLMGHIVGLLLFEEGPLSLDEIAEKLHVSKGPVSQITRKLSDNGLIRKVWVPGSRRDHYQAEDEIFGRAFSRQAELFSQNLKLATRYLDRCDRAGGDVPEHFRERAEEMFRFYSLMQKHFEAFLAEWGEDEGRPAVEREA